jgi:2',3'-cyclic-nucleotide 2'-phosphodiesterase/3'-nucleotidase
MRGDIMSKTFNLQLLQTSDVHGYVYPTSYSSHLDEPVGLAKLHTIITSIRQQNSILIDTGDTIQGSPLTYHYAKLPETNIHPMARIMNHMNYDYITIGNHEFNYGMPILHHYLDSLDATILNANILDSSTHQPFCGIPYQIKEFENGPRILFIGVTTHYIPNWEQPDHIASLSFEDAFTTTKTLVQSLRDQVDLIIVSYHGGFERNFDTFELETDDTGENQGSKMLTQIEGIDVLLTGHQHRSLSGTFNNTVYVQPGYNANTVSEIKIDGKYTDQWTFTISSELHTITDERPDPALLALIKKDEDATQEYLDTPVGFLEKDYLITDQLQARLHKHPLVSFINDVQLQFTNADIASCSLGNAISGFAKNITIRDVIGTYIYPNTIVVKKMTKQEILMALEKTAEFFTIEHGNIEIAPAFNTPKLQLYAYDMYDPIQYTITVSNPIGSRISDVSLNGMPLDDQATYTVAMNNYRASGGGDYFFIKECPTILDTQTEVIELLIDYIVQTKNITLPNRQNITVRK